MTRKDYVRIATALASVRPDVDGCGERFSSQLAADVDRELRLTRHVQWADTVAAVIAELRADNAEFDHVRFRNACNA